MSLRRRYDCYGITFNKSDYPTYHQKSYLCYSKGQALHLFNKDCKSYRRKKDGTTYSILRDVRIVPGPVIVQGGYQMSLFEDDVI
jgi:hypothetical protein